MKKTICKKCGSEDVTVTVTVNPNDGTSIAEYCRNDESITESGRCNRCGDHADPGTVGDEEPADPWLCENCGSPDVQQQAWIDLGTGEVVSYNDCDRGDYWCESCEDHHYPVRESELLCKAAEWWANCDFQAMERITGYRQHDFDPEDGCQAFVDACNGWWNGKTTEERIRIYLRNSQDA